MSQEVLFKLKRVNLKNFKRSKMKVILSIKPYYAEKSLMEKKTYELRNNI
jgi:hypothetical protein